MSWRTSLLILVAGIVGLSLLNCTVYHPQLQARVQWRNTPGQAIFSQSSSNLMSTIQGLGSQTDMEAQTGLPCTDPGAQKAIQGALDGLLLCPGSRGYNETIKIFNSHLKIHPAVVVCPMHEGDILIAIRVATLYGLVVTVKNGGHNPAGFSLHEGGLVIDMKFMDKIWTENDSGELIRSQAGAKWKEVYDLMSQIDRSIVGGGCGTVGVAGLALGGGIGWMSRSRGLVSDNMVEATIVLPNDTIAVINDQSDPELMRALRGAGGSNFGVVTEVVLKTYPAQPTYFAGSLCFHRKPYDFRSIIELYQDMINGVVKVDDRLTMDLMMGRGVPNTAQPNPDVDMCWAGFFDGPIEEALSTSKELLNGLAELVTQRDACEIMRVDCNNNISDSVVVDAKDFVRAGWPWLNNHTFSAWEAQFGGDYLDVHWKSTMSEKFTDHMVNVTVEHFSDVVLLQEHYGAKAAVEVLIEHLGGAMKKNGNSVSTWKHGNAGVMGSIQSYMWDPFSFKERGSAHHAVVLNHLKNWTDAYYEAMSLSAQGSYGNYADAELKDWEEKYYGRKNYDRLKKTKAGIPGTNMFRSAQRIHVEERPQETVLPFIKQGFRGSQSWVSNQLPFQRGSSPLLSDLLNNGGKHGAASAFRITNMASLNPSSVSLVYDNSRKCPQELVQSMIPIMPGQISSVGQTVVNVGAPADLAAQRIASARKSEWFSAETKNILLTGGTRGLGWSTTLHFAQLGVNVLYTSRSESGCHTAAAKMQVVRDTLQLSGKMACIPLALDDFDSVHSFSDRVKGLDEFRAWGSSFDAVVLNAGSLGRKGVATKAGNVLNALADNHLGHFLLIHEMLNANLINARSGKVVVLGSFAMGAATERSVASLLEIHTGSDPGSDPDWNSEVSLLENPQFHAYAAAKAINYMFASELSRRLASAGSGVTVGVAIPIGSSLTKLSSAALCTKEQRDEATNGFGLVATAEGALATVFLALHTANDGQLWVPGKVEKMSGCATVSNNGFPNFLHSQKIQCQVWEVSLRLAGLVPKNGIGNDAVRNEFVSPCAE